MARLIVRAEGAAARTIELSGAEVTLGRSPRNTLPIEDTAASRRHCRIERRSEGWTLLDLGSSNGTLLNEERVSEHVLRHGDTIRIGKTRIEFEEEVELDLGEEAGGAEEAWLVHEGGHLEGERVRVPPGRTTVGRSPKCGIRLEGAGVSGVHCELERGAGGTVLRDLGSTNGTLVNGARVEEHPLQHGDSIRIGAESLRFVDAREATLEGPEVPSDAASRAEAEARRRRPLAAILTVLGFVVLGGGGFLLYQAVSRRAPYQFPDPPAASLIQAGWSLEEPGALGQWAASEGAEIDTARGSARSGKRSLVVRVPDSERPALHAASFVERLEPPRGSAVQVTAFIDTRKLEGMAGIEARWFLPGAATPVRADRTSFVAGDGGFAPAEGVFVPPPEAERLEIAAVVYARGGAAAFDDFTVVPEEAAARVAPLESAGFELDRGAKGEIDLVRGGRPMLRDLEMVRMRDGSLWPQSIFLRDTTGPGADGAVRGEILLPDGSPGGRFESDLEADATGFIVRYRSPEPKPGVAFVLAPSLVEEGVTVISPGGWSRRYEDFENEEATALLVGTSVQIQLRFDPPLQLSVHTGADGLRCLAAAPESFEGDSVSVRLQTSFEEERSLSQRMLLDAQNARREGRLGEAITLLERIVNEFPYNPKIVSEAQTEWTELVRDAERETASLREAREEAAFFDTEARWRRVAGRARELAARLAGSRFGEVCSQTASEAEEAALRIVEGERVRDAESLVRRGEDLAGSGHEELARFVLRSVMRRYEGSEPAERAAALLADLDRR